MASIYREVTIHRPVEIVFDFVADQANEPPFNPAIVRAHEDGTTCRSAVRSGRCTPEDRLLRGLRADDSQQAPAEQEWPRDAA